MAITPAMREYLGAIYHLQQYEFQLHVSSKALAAKLGVSPPAVNRMLKRLAKNKLIVYRAYGDIELTLEGTAEAAKGLRWQRILECFALDVLGFDWQQLEAKARQMLSGVDDSVIDRMATVLNDPNLSPYGEYIPLFDQLIPRCDDNCIQNLAIGSCGILGRVRTTIYDTMTQLTEMGAVPGASYKIIGRAPFNGPMRVEISGVEQVLNRGLTLAVWVKPSDDRVTKLTALNVWSWQNSVMMRINEAQLSVNSAQVNSDLTLA